MPCAVVMFSDVSSSPPQTPCNKVSHLEALYMVNEDKPHEQGLSEVLLVDYKVIAHWDPDFSDTLHPLCTSVRR